MQPPLLPFRKILRSAAVACLLLIGVACGLKAPLYLPDKAQEVKRNDAKKFPFPKRAPTPMPQPPASTDPSQTQAPPAAGTTVPPATDPDRPATPPAGT